MCISSESVKLTAILKKKAVIAYRFRPHNQSFVFFLVKRPYIPHNFVDE